MNPSKLVAGLLIIIGAVETDNVLAQGPTIGVKAGVNLSTLYSVEVNDDKGRFGFNGGVFARAMPNQSIGAQFELLYSTKGNHSTYQGFFGLIDQTVDFNLNYLEVPALVAFRFADQLVEFQVGGYVGYLVNANVTTDGDLGNGTNELDKDNFNSVDAGLAFGVAVNTGPAQIGVRYEHGLTEVASSDNAKLLLGDAKNACVQFYIAFGIPATE